MFVAGIEIFFGFVAGGILLVLLVGTIIVTFSAIRMMARAYWQWYERRFNEMQRHNDEVFRKASSRP